MGLPSVSTTRGPTSMGAKLRRAPSFFPAAIAFALMLVPAMGAAEPSAGTAFSRGSIPLMADPKGGALGTVTPGTPLEVVKRDNDHAEVRIDGWSMTGADQYVFAAKGQRITLVRLTTIESANRKVLGHSKDDYGIDWQHVVVTGWVAPGTLTGDVAPVWAEADALFKKRCTACHALHQPTEFTANQWPHILKIMTQRAGLTQDETTLVTKYLQTHARSPGHNGPGGPPSSGAGGGAGGGNGGGRRR
jgi:hypothetical protein